MRCISSFAWLGPLYLQELICLYRPTRSLRSESKNLLYVPACRTATYGNKLFTVETAILWNDLPQEVRDAGNLSSFKRVLKTQFFNSEKLSFSMFLVYFNVFWIGFACQFRNIIVLRLRATCRISALYKCMNYYILWPWVFQMPVKWFTFFRFKSKPQNILQNIMQIRKPNLV